MISQKLCRKKRRARNVQKSVSTIFILFPEWLHITCVTMPCSVRVSGSPRGSRPCTYVLIKKTGIYVGTHREILVCTLCIRGIRGAQGTLRNSRIERSIRRMFEHSHLVRFNVPTQTSINSTAAVLVVVYSIGKFCTHATSNTPFHRNDFHVLRTWISPTDLVIL